MVNRRNSCKIPWHPLTRERPRRKTDPLVFHAARRRGGVCVFLFGSALHDPAGIPASRHFDSGRRVRASSAAGTSPAPVWRS